jgi:hypothetical protein
VPASILNAETPMMSRRSKRIQPKNKQSTKPPKQDHRIHPVKTLRGRSYIFTDKHHHCRTSDHGCWLKEISREIEFSLFQDAETGDYSDERGNLFNVHKDGEEFIEIGTKHELLATFWNPRSAAEWHGHPCWPIKTREPLNRSNQDYRPSKAVMLKMVEKGRMAQHEADRILRGDHP